MDSLLAACRLLLAACCLLCQTQWLRMNFLQMLLEVRLLVLVVEFKIC